MDISSKIAEVIETSNQEFVAQCYELDVVPALGSLVKTRNRDVEIYGIVYSSATHSIEPGRRITARGRSLHTEDDIFRENPQLAKLLCSDFRAMVTGYRNGGAIYQYLPPSPASIYGFVFQCEPAEVREFAGSFNFLNLLIDTRLQLATDDVIAAFLRNTSRTYEEPRDFLVRAGKELAWLLSNDIRRLDSILKRLRA